MSISKTYLLISGLVTIGVLIIIGVVMLTVQPPVPQPPANLDEFAKCIADKGIVMYGSIYCSHCNAEKEMFGDSWQYMRYVECSEPNGMGQIQQCRDAGITAYPTWVLSDGSQTLGEKSFEELSQMSGCKLEQ